MKKILLRIIVMMFLSILGCKSNDKFITFDNCLELQVKIRKDNETLEMTIKEDFDKIEELFTKLNKEEVDIDQRVGWSLFLTGINRNKEENITLSIDGIILSVNQKNYKCNSEDLENIIYYFESLKN